MSLLKKGGRVCTQKSGFAVYAIVHSPRHSLVFVCVLSNCGHATQHMHIQMWTLRHQLSTSFHQLFIFGFVTVNLRKSVYFISMKYKPPLLLWPPFPLKLSRRHSPSLIVRFLQNWFWDHTITEIELNHIRIESNRTKKRNWEYRQTERQNQIDCTPYVKTRPVQ